MTQWNLQVNWIFHQLLLRQKKLKRQKKTAKKAEISESEDEPESLNLYTMPTTTTENNVGIAYSSASSTSTATSNSNINNISININGSTNNNSKITSPLSQSTFKHSNEELIINNTSGRSALIYNKVSQPSPLSSVSYVNYYEEQAELDKTNNNNSLTTAMAQSPVLPIQSMPPIQTIQQIQQIQAPTTPLFGPSSTTPKIDNSTVYSFTNGPALTISTAPLSNSQSETPQEETIIDLFNRNNKSFRRPRSISLNSHFQPNNDVRPSLSPLLMSTFKNSTALKLDQPPLFQNEQYNNIKLSNNNAMAYQGSLSDAESPKLFNPNNLSTSYIPPMHGKGKETIPAQSPIKTGLNDMTIDNDQSMTSPIIKKPTENVIQRYRRARTLSSPAVPPSVDKKSHFYSPFMTGLDIKYDFYIPKSNNAISPLSSSFTASDTNSFEINREEITRRRSQSINERNRPNINDF